MKKLISLFVCALALMVSACCSDKSACAQKVELRKSLANTTWIPVFLKDAENAKMPDASKGEEPVFMAFAEDIRVNGMSGNNLFGGYPHLTDNGDFKGDSFYSTRKMGPYGEYEVKFLKALSEANRIELCGDTLSFFNGSDLLLKFKKSTLKK